MSRSGSYQLRHSQNFLVNRHIVSKLVDESGIQARDTVVEIGPGRGIITRELAKAARQVIAVERDEVLALRLASSPDLPSNVAILIGDALTVPLPSTPYRVFASIPYRHTAAIVGRLTTGTAPPLDSWLVVQREAAHRYGVSSRNTMQSIQLAPWFDCTIVHEFRKQDFDPRPGVDSVLLHLHHRIDPLIANARRANWNHFVDALFSAWQPTFAHALKARLSTRIANDVLRRSGLTWHGAVSGTPLDDWIRVFASLVSLNQPDIWQRLENVSRQNDERRARLDRPSRTRTNRR